MWQKLVERKWIVILVVDLVLVNLAVFGLLVRSSSSGQAEGLVSSQTQAMGDTCGSGCRAYIDQRVASPTPSLRPTATPRPTAVVAPTVRLKTRQVQYFAILGSGQTISNDWADISGTEFYFDKANYPGLVEIDFEANAKLVNGNGSAYIRIYDVTHGLAVQGSEVSTTGQTSSVVVSGALGIWDGNNLYRIQAKSLTADTAVFNSGRLKIATED